MGLTLKLSFLYDNIDRNASLFTIVTHITERNESGYTHNFISLEKSSKTHRENLCGFLALEQRD